MRPILLAGVAGLVLFGCKNDDASTDESTDSDPVETDTDTDTDVDSDTDADTDTDTDADTDTDVQPVACPVAIPSTADVLNSNGQYLTAGGDVWVCGRSIVGVGADSVTAYVSGNRAQVYTSGATGITIWVEGSSDVLLQSDGNTVYHTSGSTVDDRGNGNTVVECDTVPFDLTNAPSSGC